MKLAVLRESFPGERRVALVPSNVPQLIKAGFEVAIESGAGMAAGFLDSAYANKGATIASRRDEVFSADVLVQVRSLGANPVAGASDLPRFRSGQIVIGLSDPLGTPELSRDVAQTGATHFSLELIPRITRAQSMDVLSSMATIAGYRAVLLGAIELPKLFPMMMTAAGTLTASRVFVIGAGVAGLQAMATAKKLGATVQGYDVRVACKEQVESVGAKFVEIPLETKGAEDAGGYAKALGEDFYQKQRAFMATVAAQSDVIVTTAAIPGQKSPLLITADAVNGMAPGSVIVDLAAERGGNCELSQPDQRVVHNSVVIIGPTNLPSEVPNHASQMFSQNVTRFLQHLAKSGLQNFDLSDQIIRDTLVTRSGNVVHARLRELLKLSPLAA